jgi:hypothetical protein
MVMMHINDNEEALLDYLYEEGDPAERLKIARHLQDCATCSVAVIELQSVRGLLSEWTPPHAALGFKIVREMPGIGSRLGALWPAWPRWAQVAAGMFLFAAGMGFSQLHFEYGSGALTLRTRSAPPSAAASIQPAHVGSDIPLPAAPVSASEPSRSASADEVLQRVKTLIDQSESRQQRELALRLAQVVNDFDAQRRADLLRVDQNFGQLEGQTGAEVARQRDLLNRVLVSGQGK